jgi:hypothetical protein
MSDKKIILILLLLIVVAVFANDGRIIAAATVQLIDDDKTNVSMHEEEIVITLHKKHYEVNVSFKFYNDGPNEKILIGFPITVGGYAKDIEEVKTLDVELRINGEVLSPRDYIIKEEHIKEPSGYNRFTKWIMRKVEFKSKSYTNSEVTYKMPYGEDGSALHAAYTYGTGRSWKGPIGKMIVIVKHNDDVMIGELKDVYSNMKPTSFTWEANGRYRYVFENVKPKDKHDKLMIYVEPIDFSKKHKIFQCLDYGIFHCNFDEYDGGWFWSNTLLYKDPTDIKLFTKNQVRLFINYFFAIHGYDFKNPYYKNYFQNLESVGNGGKYKINPNFTEENFNDFERKNVDFLLKMEKMIPTE